MNKTAILIINWNDYQNTKECLDSLIQNNSENDFNIILIDNNSQDGSKERLIKEYNLQAILPSNWNCEKKDIFINDTHFSDYQWWNVCLELNDNYWFTGANNFWMKFAWQHNFENIMWLNNDTIVSKWFLWTLEEWLSQYPNNLLSCKIVFFPDTEYIWNMGTKINLLWKPTGIYYQKKTNEVKTPKYIESELCSWCMMIYKRSVLERLWWQDNNYFFNIDDADYSYEAKLKWFNTIIDTKTILYHKSARSMVWKPWLSMYYWLRNLVYFRRKYFPFYKNLWIYLYIIIHSIWVFIIYWLKWVNTYCFFIDLFHDIIHKKYGKYSKQK